MPICLPLLPNSPNLIGCEEIIGTLALRNKVLVVLESIVIHLLMLGGFFLVMYLNLNKKFSSVNGKSKYIPDNNLKFQF